jgi:hypothetical protein
MVWVFYWSSYFRRPVVTSWGYNPVEMGPDDDATLEIRVFNRNIRTDIEIRSTILRRWFRSYPIEFDWLGGPGMPNSDEIVIPQYPVVPILRDNVVFVRYNREGTGKLHHKRVKLFIVANNGRKSRPIRFRLQYVPDVFPPSEYHTR